MLKYCSILNLIQLAFKLISITLFLMLKGARLLENLKNQQYNCIDYVKEKRFCKIMVIFIFSAIPILLIITYFNRNFGKDKKESCILSILINMKVCLINLALYTIISLIAYKCFIVRQQFNNILDLKNNDNLKKIHQAIYRIYQSIEELMIIFAFILFSHFL